MRMDKVFTALTLAWLLAAIGLLGGASQGSDADDELAPYLSPEARVAEAVDLARSHPGEVELLEYGKSPQGEALLALRLHFGGQGPKPAAFVGACIHGNEWIGNRMAMAIARLLVEDPDDPLAASARQRLDFYVVPCENPDAYRRTWEHARGQAGPDDDWAYCRKNANGVDLNRNWPLPGRVTIPIEWAGSPDPASINYRGPAPLSEPETAALDRFFADRPEIIAGFNFHSTGAVLYPAHCPTAACVRRYKAILKTFQQAQPHRRYPRLQSRVFDTYTGELEDWLYAEYGVLVTDVELSHAKQNQKACACQDLFWTFNPKDPTYWIENDARATITACLEAERIMGGQRVPEAVR